MKRLFTFILTFSIFAGLQAQYTEKQLSLGKMVFEVMDETYGIYQDSAMQAFVEKVGHNIEEVLEEDYTFQYFITDQEELNAFATAGGYVFVTRGLLGLINSEDELACVLGHEITHVTKNHTTQSNRASILPNILQLPANIIGLLTYQEVANIINFPINRVSNLGLSSFSRAHEREADRIGVELAYKAGYDPYMLPHILTKMDKFGKTVYGLDHKFSLFDDHPMTEDRVELIHTQLKEMGVEEKSITSGSKLEFQDGMLFGRNPRYGSIADNVFIHGGLRGYIKFPEDYAVQGTTKSVTAASPNGNSSILISIDSLSNSPELTAKLELSNLDGVTLLSHERTRVNGLEAYKAIMEYKQARQPVLHSEVLWIRLPTTNTIIRAVTVRPAKDPDPSLDQCMNSIRELHYDELKDWYYYEFRLLDEELPSPKNPEEKTYVDLIRMLNDMDGSSSSTEDGKLKVLEVRRLQDYEYPFPMLNR